MSKPTATGAGATGWATPQAMSIADERNWAMFVHLSGLSGLIIPLGGILGPLILWLIKKDQSAFVNRHGKSALNFQISLMIYAVGFGILVLIIAIATLGIGLILMFPLIIIAAIAFGILGIVFPILACLKAQNGEEYRYPLTITMLK